MGCPGHVTARTGERTGKRILFQGTGVHRGSESKARTGHSEEFSVVSTTSSGTLFHLAGILQ